MKRQPETPKNTIIYGGAFNPPTVAHLNVLQACVDYGEQVNGDVWLLPSGSRQDKNIDVPLERRLELVNALARDAVTRTVNIAICDDELMRAEHTETIDTVQYFNDKYPERRFIWVYGADSYASMDTWQSGDWMKQNLPMLVIERPGYDMGLVGSNVDLLKVPEMDVSSTEVRTRLSQHRSVRCLVSASVYELLRVAP